jgi:hypothetical protein
VDRYVIIKNYWITNSTSGMKPNGRNGYPVEHVAFCILKASLTVKDDLGEVNNI